MKIELIPQNAQVENFAPFGMLLEPQTADYTCPEFDWYENLARVSLGVAEIGLVRAKAAASGRQKALEQHKNTKEIIIPAERPVILVLAKPDAFEKAARADDFAAFTVPPGCAAVINEGVWHYGPMCAGKDTSAFVLYTGFTGSRDKKLLNMDSLGIEINVNKG